jgi:hypothetical protein
MAQGITQLQPINQANDRFASRDELANALKKQDKPSYIFPGNLSEIDHWMCFRVNKQEFRRNTDFPLSRDEARIFLPLPNSLGTQYDQSYGAEGVGVAGLAGANIGKSFSEGGGGISSLIDSVANLERKDVADAAVYYGAQAAEENLGAIVGAAVGGTSNGRHCRCCRSSIKRSNCRRWFN